MNDLDILRNELEKLRRRVEPEKKSVPAAERVVLSQEQINSFFEAAVLPAFRRIADALKDFPLRAYIYKHLVVARILITDATTRFNFGVAVYSSDDSVQIYFNYGEKYTLTRFRARSSFDGPISFLCESIDLSEYERVTEEYLIEIFVRFYLSRDEIADGINEKRKIDRERVEAAIEEQRRIDRMNGEGDAEDYYD